MNRGGSSDPSSNNHSGWRAGLFLVCLGYMKIRSMKTHRLEVAKCIYYLMRENYFSLSPLSRECQLASAYGILMGSRREKKCEASPSRKELFSQQK